MKSNLIKITLILLALLLVPQTGFCGTEASAETAEAQAELVVMMVKFGKVMFGVIVASVIIYALLLVWNHIAKRSDKKTSADLSLKTPQNTEDAILFFINKNKIN